VIPDALTSPEWRAERELAKRVRQRMTNVCDFCIHRQQAWGISYCPHEGRKFPVCVETPGVSFELDESQVRGNP
jgi:hypothetical protein